jgi:hypothetical protein
MHPHHFDGMPANPSRTDGRVTADDAESRDADESPAQSEGGVSGVETLAKMVKEQRQGSEPPHPARKISIASGNGASARAKTPSDQAIDIPKLVIGTPAWRARSIRESTSRRFHMQAPQWMIS